MEEERAPQNAEGRDQERDREGPDWTDIRDQPEVEDVGPGCADQADGNKGEPHLGAAPRGGRLNHSRCAKHGREQQGGADLAAERDQLRVQAASLADPALGQKSRRAVAARRNQARQRPRHHGDAEVDRAGRDQGRDTCQPQHDADGLLAGHPLAEKQRADDDAHERRRGVQDCGICHWQEARRDAIHGKRDPGVNDAKRKGVFEFAFEIPSHTQHGENDAQPESAEKHAKKGGGKRADNWCCDFHKQKTCTPDGGQQQMSEMIRWFHGEPRKLRKVDSRRAGRQG